MTLIPFSRSQEGSDCWKMAFLHPISRMNGWILTNLVQLYCWDRDKNWLDFGELDTIFKVTGDSDCWKMACLHPISRINGWILTKHVHLYCCDIEKNFLDFGDLYPIFKITQGLRLLKNGLDAPYLQNEWMDFDQTCTTILLWHEKELIRFLGPWPHFQSHRRAQIVGKCFFCTLSPEWMDGFWPNLYSYIVETGTRID